MVCRGALRLWQESEPLIKVQGPNTNSCLGSDVTDLERRFGKAGARNHLVTGMGGIGFGLDGRRRLTRALTLAKQQEPCGLRTSQAHSPRLISAEIRSGIVHLPVALISSLAIASVNPKQ